VQVNYILIQIVDIHENILFTWLHDILE